MSYILLNSAEIPEDARRILVIRLGAMGDVVRTLPAVAELRARRPAAEIHWLLERRVRGAVEGRAYVDGIVEFPRDEIETALRSGALGRARRRFGEFARSLRGGRYDVAFDFHSIARSALLSRVSRAPMRVGYEAPYAREGAQRAATHRAKFAPAVVSRFDRNLALVDFAARRTSATPAAPAPIAVERDGVADFGLEPGPAPILLHPGSSPKAAHKRWGVAGFADLAKRLAAEGERVLVVYGPGEEPQAASVVEASRGAATLAPATPSFDALAALLARGRAFVGSDSGPLHTASLVGTPVVQLLGPTHPVENAPWAGTPSRTVRGGQVLACSPCRRGCAAAACMREISSSAVHAALRDLIGAPQRERNARPQLAPRGNAGPAPPA